MIDSADCFIRISVRVDFPESHDDFPDACAHNSISTILTGRLFLIYLSAPQPRENVVAMVRSPERVISRLIIRAVPPILRLPLHDERKMACRYCLRIIIREDLSEAYFENLKYFFLVKDLITSR